MSESLDLDAILIRPFRCPCDDCIDYRTETTAALIAELRATRAERLDAVARAERAEAELADAKGIIVEQEADARYGRAARVAGWQERALRAEAAIARVRECLTYLDEMGYDPACLGYDIRAALDGTDG